MKVKIGNAGGCRRVLHVTASADESRPEYDKVVGEFGKSARIAGFRRGKAPLELVERQFGGKILQETQDRLVPRFYHEALAEKGIAPVAIVEVNSVSFAKDDGLAFQVVVDVTPDFRLPRYKRVSLVGQKIEVTENDVDAAITDLRERFGRYEDVDGRAVQDNDLVRIDYAGLCDGQPMGELAPGCSGLGEGKDFWARVGEPEFLPGFPAGLKGSTVGETREIAVEFPADHPVEAARGRKAVYTVAVKGLRERLLPDLDKTFLDQLGIESEEQLRERVRTDLVEAAEAGERQRLRDEVAKHLLAKATFDLPQALVDQETNVAAQDIVRRMAMGGQSREQIQGRRDEIVSAAAQASTERVKLTYILNGIAEAEDITVSNAELDDRIREMAERNRMPPERMKGEIEKVNGAGRLRRSLREDKVMDFILEHAKIKIK